LDIRKLNTFRTIAALGSFNKAADVLHYAQSTVSEQIKTLEGELGKQLFHRDGKYISLTPAGELFLQYAQKMINLEEEVRTEIKGSEEVHGSLSIRIPETISTYYLPPVLKKFKSRYPYVQLQCNSCSSLGLNEELRSGIINLAFLITNEFRDADLETQKLMEVPLTMVTYPKNLLAARSSVQVTDLKNEPIFATSSDCSYFKKLEELFAGNKTRMSTVYRINSIEAIKQNIIGGTGVALLSKISVQKEISKGLLVELPLEKGHLSAGMLMIRLKNKWHPPILEAFMEIMKETFSPAAGNSKS